MKPSLIVGTLTLLTVLTSPARGQARLEAPHEGGSSTGGADQRENRTNEAWYLGHDRVIEICIADHGQSTYPITDAEVKNAITTAYSTWRKYLTEHVVDKYGKDRTPATRIRWETCALDTEVTVYLGIQTAELTEAAKSHENPRAFVHGRKIWFGNFYRVETGNNFLALALHEIGHTLGLPHVDGTIMTKDIAMLLHHDTMEAENEQSKRYVNMDPSAKWRHRDTLLAQIEYEEALLNPVDQDVKITQSLAPTRIFDYIEIRSPEKTFEIFTGHKSQGPISVTWKAKLHGTFMDPTADGIKTDSPEFELVLSDAKTSTAFKLNYVLSKRMTQEEAQSDLFRVKDRSLTKYLLKLEFNLTAKTGKKLELSGTYWGGRFLDLDYADTEPAIREILKSNPKYDRDISENEIKALSSAKIPFHLFQAKSDLVLDQWLWKR